MNDIIVSRVAFIMHHMCTVSYTHCLLEDSSSVCMVINVWLIDAGGWLHCRSSR